MSNHSSSIEDIADELWSSSDSVEIAEEALKAKAVVNKDARRRVEDLMEERRLRKSIEDDYFD